MRDILSKSQRGDKATDGRHQFKLFDHLHDIRGTNRLIKLLVKCLHAFGHSATFRIVAFVAKEEFTVQLLMPLGEVSVLQQVGG